MDIQRKAFQDRIQGNHCWGCGNLNSRGLQIKSYWSGEESVCDWRPQEYHMAGPPHILNGGIIATVIDCHCVCTAIASAYLAAGREIGTGEPIWYATASLNVSYKSPTPIVEEVSLRARVKDVTERKTLLTCTLYAEGEERARAELLAVRVPLEWMEQGS